MQNVSVTVGWDKSCLGHVNLSSCIFKKNPPGGNNRVSSCIFPKDLTALAKIYRRGISKNTVKKENLTLRLCD